MADNAVALSQLMCSGGQRGQLGHANGLFGEERNDGYPRAEPAHSIDLLDFIGCSLTEKR